MTESFQDQLPLSVRKGRKGRHERAADRTITVARADGQLTDVDVLLTTALRALARQLDAAEREANAWAVAAITREIREMLHTAKLTASERVVTADDPFASFMQAMAADDVPVRNPAQS